MVYSLLDHHPCLSTLTLGDLFGVNLPPDVVFGAAGGIKRASANQFKAKIGGVSLLVSDLEAVI